MEYAFWRDGERVVYLWHPPAPEPCPLLVVLDGQDCRRRAKLANIVDNLMTQGRIRPVALAWVHHGGRARGVECACSKATLGFLLHRVLPLAQAEANPLDIGAAPGAFGILGASLGGLVALYAGVRAPGILSGVLSQSGVQHRRARSGYLGLDPARTRTSTPDLHGRGPVRVAAAMQSAHARTVGG